MKGKTAAWKGRAAPAKAKLENIQLRSDRRACRSSDDIMLIAEKRASNTSRSDFL